MASGAVVRPLASISTAIGVKHAAKRGFGTSQQLQRQLLRNEQRLRPTQIPKQSLQQSFRRGYAEQKQVLTEKTKRRGRGFFRWTWRLMYLSALGGLGYTGYLIYQGRYPADQEEPDPSKKTLVVLGMWLRLNTHHTI